MEIPRQPRPSTSAFPRTRRARAWPARGGRGTHLYRVSGAVSALELKLKIPVPHMHRLSSLAQPLNNEPFWYHGSAVPTEKRDPSRVPFIKAKPSLDELTDGEVVHHQKRGAKKC